jgi:hypothetical protein
MMYILICILLKKDNLFISGHQCDTYSSQKFYGLEMGSVVDYLPNV